MSAKFADQIASRLGRRTPESTKLEALVQVSLTQHFKYLKSAGLGNPSFRDVEYSLYSQNNEDGILILIFSLIGEGKSQVVELCASDGIECNAANLIINRGWSGLLFDGDQRLLDLGKQFYSERTNAWRFRRLPPLLVQAWITAENVNQLIESNGFSGEIDLLSIDVDGVDYWIWKAIDIVQPRVVVIEYNNRWPSDRSVTIPYRSDFSCVEPGEAGAGYFGASLRALVKLGSEKGYRLIGANSPNTNAFFLKAGIGEDEFPEVSVESCLSSDYARHQVASKYPALSSKLVVEV